MYRDVRMYAYQSHSIVIIVPPKNAENVHWLSFHLALFDFLNWTIFLYSLNILLSRASNVVCKVFIHSSAFYTAHFLNLNEAVLASNAKCWTTSSNYIQPLYDLFLLVYSLSLFWFCNSPHLSRGHCKALTLNSQILSNEQVVTYPYRKVGSSCQTIVNTFICNSLELY